MGLFAFCAFEKIFDVFLPPERVGILRLGAGVFIFGVFSRFIDEILQCGTVLLILFLSGQIAQGFFGGVGICAGVLFILGVAGGVLFILGVAGGVLFILRVVAGGVLFILRVIAGGVLFNWRLGALRLFIERRFEFFYGVGCFRSLGAGIARSALICVAFFLTFCVVLFGILRFLGIFRILKFFCGRFERFPIFFRHFIVAEILFERIDEIFIFLDGFAEFRIGRIEIFGEVAEHSR